MVKIKNLSGFPLAVQVVRPDGADDTVHVAVRGRVTLADGFKVNDTWLAINGKDVMVEVPDQPQPVIVKEVGNDDDR